METYSITEARNKLGALARRVCAEQTTVSLTDRGQPMAILMSPAEALELEELRALEQYRTREANGQVEGVSQEEAVRRIFGDQA